MLNSKRLKAIASVLVISALGVIPLLIWSPETRAAIQGGIQQVVGTGTAGAPGTAVLTIQGIGGGTAVPVSGTFTPSGTQTVAGNKTNNNASLLSRTV